MRLINLDDKEQAENREESHGELIRCGKCGRKKICKLYKKVQDDNCYCSLWEKEEKE